MPPKEKDDCLACPILTTGTCPILDLAYSQKGLDGIIGCQMRLAVERTMRHRFEEMRIGGKIKNPLPAVQNGYRKSRKKAQGSDK